MKKTALIEKGKDGRYTIYSADIASTIIGDGDTVAEAKSDFENTLREVIEAYAEDGEDLPEELQGVEFEYKYDIPSVFDEFSFINVSKFAEYAGINASLLRQYKTRNTYISEAQAKKIESALHALGRKLTAVSL
ncbi:MAG: type II toxin-antitoxin system HicB family antitoxin [Alistipes sp.]|nr:type II toxin-antitoxin system HicB family antitoxin [Alistipes sp.]